MTLLGIGLTLGVLDALTPEDEDMLRDSQKRLGFNQPKRDIKGQELWNDVILKIVDHVTPLCGWRKGEWHKAGKSSPQVRDRAVKFVAQLLHTCYPGVWPDDYKQVGKRYRDAKGRQQT